MRPQFTPRIWHSEDGKWTYRMDRHGITDIVPGPRHRFMSWLEDQPEYPKLKTQLNHYPKDAHVHWAHNKEEKD